jgi:hypothetical protein
VGCGRQNGGALDNYGSGKCVEIKVSADPLYQHLLVTVAEVLALR